MSDGLDNVGKCFKLRCRNQDEISNLEPQLKDALEALDWALIVIKRCNKIGVVPMASFAKEAKEIRAKFFKEKE